jgi:hypothetical protein
LSSMGRTDSGSASYGEAVAGIGASGTDGAAVGTGGDASFAPEHAVAAAMASAATTRVARPVVLMILGSAVASGSRSLGTDD